MAPHHPAPATLARRHAAHKGRGYEKRTAACSAWKQRPVDVLAGEESGSFAVASIAQTRPGFSTGRPLRGVEAELGELDRHALGADEAGHQADDGDVVLRAAPSRGRAPCG